MSAGPPRPVYCPWCAVQVPAVLVPLTMIEHELREGGKEYRYACPRCDYQEFQEQPIE